MRVTPRLCSWLADTYWSSSGCIPGDPKLSAEDFDHAKAHGLMFDPVPLSHSEVITRLRVAADRLDERKGIDQQRLRELFGHVL